MLEQFNPMVYQADKLREELEKENVMKMEKQIQDYMERLQQETSHSQHCNRKVTDKTLHSIFLGIPSLGEGFEHLVGKTPQLGNMINFLNEGGFMRAVPLEFSPLLQRQEGSGSSLEASASIVPSVEGSMHDSRTSLGSATGSAASLTSSQKSVYHIENQSRWPLGRKEQLGQEK